MKKALSRTLLAVVIFTSGCVASSVNNSVSLTDSKDMLLPEINVSDLEGKDYKLPADFESENNIVAFGFAHGQQKSIDTWLPHLKELCRNNPNISYFEIPVIDSKNAVLRTIIRNGMRTGITESDDRQRTLTLFVEHAKFLQAIKITDPSQIAVIVFDRTGKALWNGFGDFSQQKYEQLVAAIGLKIDSKA